METTFITIHDLSLDARILYASSSILDILGYRPDEVVGKSCWEYFHPDEIPFAQAVHGRGIQLDKAAVLNYCQIKSRSNLWIGCECVFTIVYDVLVGCTSIYKQGAKSQQRAADAPIIRQLFSSSPKDPRYHMLSYISSKFSQGSPGRQSHEARAALFLNRFTRTLTIMYASNGLEDVLGITADELTGKSFYYCIQENCLPEAIRCLESAKANDSIAYLRFWYRDPRQDDLPSDQDETMSDAPSSEAEDDDGGVQLGSQMDVDSIDHDHYHDFSSSSGYRSPERVSNSRVPSTIADSSSHSPGDSSQSKTPDLVFDPAPKAESSSSSVGMAHENGSGGNSSSPRAKGLRSSGKMQGEQQHSQQKSQQRQQQHSQDQPLEDRTHQPEPRRHIELEAVVSCTSDGLVLVLRAARPFVLDSLRPAPRVKEPPSCRNGFFASPWAERGAEVPTVRANISTATTDGAIDRYRAFPPSRLPVNNTASTATANHYAEVAARGPRETEVMNSIREVAVFAWALTGINGSIAQYGRGKPRLGSQPFGGLPIWERDARI